MTPTPAHGLPGIVAFPLSPICPQSCPSNVPLARIPGGRYSGRGSLGFCVPSPFGVCERILSNATVFLCERGRGGLATTGASSRPGRPQVEEEYAMSHRFWLTLALFLAVIALLSQTSTAQVQSPAPLGTEAPSLSNGPTVAAECCSPSDREPGCDANGQPGSVVASSQPARASAQVPSPSNGPTGAAHSCKCKDCDKCCKCGCK